MSLFHPAIMTCPNCGTETEVERNASVNADMRPDLRAALLDGSFQAEDCPKCATPLRLPPHLTLLDISHGLWIMCRPIEALDSWPTEEAEAHEVFDTAFGPTAPAAAREIGAELDARLVFGWAALREKLLARDLELDDVTLELLKAAIMRDVDHPPMADESELRLIAGDDATLSFAWIVAATEERLALLDVPRDTYDDLEDDDEAWAPLRERLESHLLVDIRRLTAGPAGA